MGSMITAGMKVWVVLVDWGTSDGYPDRVQLHDVFTDHTEANEAAERCRARALYPAVWTRVEECTLR